MVVLRRGEDHCCRRVHLGSLTVNGGGPARDHPRYVSAVIVGEKLSNSFSPAKPTCPSTWGFRASRLVKYAAMRFFNDWISPTTTRVG